MENVGEDQQDKSPGRQEGCNQACEGNINLGIKYLKTHDRRIKRTANSILTPASEDNKKESFYVEA